MKTKTIKGFKFIQSDMKSKNGNHKWEIGKWYKKEKIELCEKGFHACKQPLEAFEFVYGDKFFIVEARGEIIEEKDKKFVAQEMRLIKEINLDYVARKFALFCAKKCLPNYEKEYPNDKRVSDCIKAAEDYLDGKISLEELTAARSAAESAWSAAESARSAARSAAESARSAAWSAAESAAESARSAAWSAWSAQNKELKRLIKESMK